MNVHAYNVFNEARREYLRANGWTEQLRGRWVHPDGRNYDMRHAVNSQFFYDTDALTAPPPPTPEQELERWRRMLREAFKQRHEQHVPGTSRPRQVVRQMIRWIARATEPTTRVEKARLRRAEHASKHIPHGCPCGKEGPPY